ncbi:CENPK protein, partial [Daphoenositta chrysoptera]|nr:CENPK protein [Daphoenositta chrysoptera]
AEFLSEVTESGGAVGAKEELLEECESIWKQMEECHSKLMLQGTNTLLQSDAKLFLLKLRWKALTEHHHQWQARCPEIISSNPDVLLDLGKEELQKVKNDLEMVLSTVRSKNKKLEEDLKREQQWCEEQEQMLATLNKTEEETKTQVGPCSTKREFDELKKKIMKLKTHKKGLLSALGEFLDEHFPPLEKDENTENKNSSAEPAVELKTMQEILEMLINQLMTTPHEPYLTINESFWPPYMELLLRSGVVLRHPEDPKRLRLEAFHK